MPSVSQILEQESRTVDPKPEAFERLLRRRDRRRRNQRITAGFVGIALFVAVVWVVTSVGPLDRSDRSVVPGGSGGTGPSETGPAETGHAETRPEPRSVGHWEVLPKGTTPTAPGDSRLVAGWMALHQGLVYVYADGRVIWHPGPAGFHNDANEQRLTPEGVDLVRSGAIQPADFQSDPQRVPASAWADATIREYVPSRYAICFWEDGTGASGMVNEGYEYPSDVLPRLSSEAQAILGGNEHTYEHSGNFIVEIDGKPIECFEVDADELPSLDRTFRADKRPGGSIAEDLEGNPIWADVYAILPNGEWTVTYG